MKIIGFGELVDVDACADTSDKYGNAISDWVDYAVVGFDEGTGSYYASMDFDDVEFSIGHIPVISSAEALMSELNEIFGDELIFESEGIERLKGFSG